MSTDLRKRARAAVRDGPRPDLGERPRAELKNSESDNDLKVVENSGFLAVSAALVGVISYACTLLMANMLGTGDYTRFAAAAMVLGIVGIVANALVPLPLSHVVAVHPRSTEERRNGMAFSVFVSCLAGMAAAIIAGGMTWALANPSLAAAVALASFVIFVTNATAGWLQGELRFTWYAVATIGEVVLRLVVSLLVIVMAWGAVGAVLGFVVGCAAMLVVPPSFYRDLRWRPGVLFEKWRWAETSDIALVLCVVSVLVGIDVVVVGFLDNGSADAAGFQALATIAKGPVYVAAGSAMVAFPLLRKPGAKVSEVLGASFASFGQLVVVAFAIIATAPPVMAGLVVPVKYHGSLGLLPWLAASGLGYAVLMVLSTVLLAMRAYRRCQIGLAVASVLVIGGLWIGWQLNAVAGMAIGSAAGAVMSGLVLAVLARPIVADAGSGQGFAKFVLLGLALVAALALFALLQAAVWLVMAGVSGVAVLAHQKDLLPHRNDFKIPRWLRAGGMAPRSGRRALGSKTMQQTQPVNPLLRRTPQEFPKPAKYWADVYAAEGRP
ncbi:lipopolysaccharide biosynthesis protein [Paenarthrobacter sp. NPDC018779]|uniref:lipopolysaccharide biosynthesis protein n=1 Tax=Paenarthrobacter sp. NPDC018779 TaxID=3364375 RepID=UPI0037C61AED